MTWAARHELALSLDDVLARRTRLAQELPDRGAAIAPRVAELLGAELGWGETRRAREVEAYLEVGRSRVRGHRVVIGPTRGPSAGSTISHGTAEVPDIDDLWTAFTACAL